MRPQPISRRIEPRQIHQRRTMGTPEMKMFVRELAEVGIPYRGIVRRVFREFGVDIAPSTARNWATK